MDELKVVIYQHGIPMMRVSTEEVKIESNVEDAYTIARGEDGALRKIKVGPKSSPLMIKFEGTVDDIEIFNMLTKPREGL